MKTISADFNAMTEAGHVRLTLPCSHDDVLMLGLGPGDWAWLSDSEVMVGAQLGLDERYGLVGVPHWDTIVHLDDEGADDVNLIRSELMPLLNKRHLSHEDEPRILELLTQAEYTAPPRLSDQSPGTFAFRRALALRQMGKLGLALVEMKDARSARPDDSIFSFVYLDLLRLENLPAAVAEAQSIAESSDVPALVLSACINIVAAWAEQASESAFASIAQQVLAWCRRFDQLPDLDQAGPSLVALSYFNRGLVLLRAGRISLARQAFENAQRHFPVGPILDEVTGLETYDRHAREVAERVRTVIAEQFPMSPAAA